MWFFTGLFNYQFWLNYYFLSKYWITSTCFIIRLWEEILNLHLILKILLSLYSNNENFGYIPTLKINNSPCGIGTFFYRDKLRISQPLILQNWAYWILFHVIRKCTLYKQRVWIIWKCLLDKVLVRNTNMDRVLWNGTRESRKGWNNKVCSELFKV